MADSDSMNQEELRKAPDRFFDDPMEIVDAQRYRYEVKLDLLQSWLARTADGRAAGPSGQEVQAAIVALQARAEMHVDKPADAPDVHNYGVVERTDLRRYSMSSLARRISRIFRR
ncbi:phage terminase Nu1 subunit (DNA packaging protein) [Rhodovulum iodosum]|uniref:Phage terminase Nu1 subunit (DNA packaging protein) n=1 Tax=Rhodovulum iodosum TaxID=68291 RepID=A0ABV3XV67_9RHOB|nr:hypothetical protein [Rhodovulum robiginosum]RSK32137.1 hypothetical protein EJA01_13005 [Rhodovulum robiginosum]